MLKKGVAAELKKWLKLYDEAMEVSNFYRDIVSSMHDVVDVYSAANAELYSPALRIVTAFWNDAIKRYSLPLPIYEGGFEYCCRKGKWYHNEAGGLNESDGALEDTYSFDDAFPSYCKFLDGFATKIRHPHFEVVCRSISANEMDDFLGDDEDFEEKSDGGSASPVHNRTENKGDLLFDEFFADLFDNSIAAGERRTFEEFAAEFIEYADDAPPISIALYRNFVEPSFKKWLHDSKCNEKEVQQVKTIVEGDSNSPLCLFLSYVLQPIAIDSKLASYNGGVFGATADSSDWLSYENINLASFLAEYARTEAMLVLNKQYKYFDTNSKHPMLNEFCVDCY